MTTDIDPRHWLYDLVKLPEHRFKALKRKRLKQQKVFEAQQKRGTLKSVKAYNTLYNEVTAIILAEQIRKKKNDIKGMIKIVICYLFFC